MKSVSLNKTRERMECKEREKEGIWSEEMVYDGLEWREWMITEKESRLFLYFAHFLLICSVHYLIYRESV